MATSIATFLPAEIWQNVFEILGSWDRLSEMTHAWTTLRLVNSTFKKDVEARFKQLFNEEQIRIRIIGGIYCATWDTFSEAKAKAYDDYIARKHPRSYKQLYASKYSVVVDKTDMHFGRFQEHDEEHVLFHSLRTRSSNKIDPREEDKDHSLHVSLGFRRLMELRAGSEESCTGALPADPTKYFSLTALQHFTRRQWKGPQLQRLYPASEEVDPFLKSPIQVTVGSWKTNCPISDIGFDFQNGTLQFAWREILASFFNSMRLANALHSEDDTLRARAWKEVRGRRERTRLAGSRFPSHSVAWDGNVESLISKWDSSGPSEEPMLLALRDSKCGQKIRQQVLTVPRWDKYPSPLDYEEKKAEGEYAFDEAGLMSTDKYIPRKDLEPTATSVTPAASPKAQSEAVQESTTTLKRKRTPTNVATDFELVGDLGHDDTLPLSAKRRCIDSNATNGCVVSKRAYRGGSGLVAKVHSTESQQNILNNQPAGTSNSSASSSRNASGPSFNNFETLPRDRSHIAPRRSHSEVHRNPSLKAGLVPQMIESSIISTPKSGHPLTPRPSGEIKGRVSARINTPLSAPANLGGTNASRIDGGLSCEAPRRSQGTGSRIVTPSGSSLPAIPGFTRQKKRTHDDGPGFEIPQGCSQSPFASPRMKAPHPSGYDLKTLEGFRRRAEASPSPAPRPPMKKKRTRL